MSNWATAPGRRHVANRREQKRYILATEGDWQKTVEYAYSLPLNAWLSAWR